PEPEPEPEFIRAGAILNYNSNERIMGVGKEILVDGKNNYSGQILAIRLVEIYITGTEYSGKFEIFNSGGERLDREVIEAGQDVVFYDSIGDEIGVDAFITAKQFFISATG
ncbi:MAG: hypothetical protein ABID38_05375, partial [Candidatus Diapherotrites archaeon]